MAGALRRRSVPVGSSDRNPGLIAWAIFERPASSTSDSPNRPTTIATKLTPSSSRDSPKVNRGAPATGSIPTMAISSPRTPEISARTMDRPARATSSDSPTSTSAKNSGGPIFRPSEPSGRAASTSRIVATVPPTKEPRAAMVKAGPARPCLVIS